MENHTVGSRLGKIRDSFHLNQREFSERMGTLPQNWSRYESDIIPIPDDMKVRLREIFRINLDWLMSGEGEMFVDSLSTKLPILDIKASAGYGYKNLDNPPILEYFDIEKHFLFPYSRERVIVAQVRGDSMQPSFYDGDLVAVALGVVESNGVYVINIKGNLLIKRLQFIREEKIVIKSDNKLYDDEEIDAQFSEHFSIIGKVFRRIHRV